MDIGAILSSPVVGKGMGVMEGIGGRNGMGGVGGMGEMGEG